MPLDEAQAITLLRRWFDEIWHEGNLDVLDQLVHDPYARHTSQGSETISVAEYRKRVVQSQRVLHGAATTIDDYVVSGDKIWARATSRGVNLETVGPNTITWMSCYRMVDGKVAEAWIATLPGVDWDA
jgi:predicted SnoaL-like aldol condensation-catalyzing enzyme